MAQPRETDFCALLDLPAEIHNTIYSYILEVDLDDSANIADWRNLLPDQPVTELNRRITSECLSLCQEIRTRAWNNCSLTLVLDSRFSEKTFRDNVLYKCRSLPQSARIRRFHVQFNFPGGELDDRPYSAFEWRIHDGKAKQRFTPKGSRGWYDDTECIERRVQRLIRDYLAFPLVLQDEEPHLDGVEIVEMVQSMFDEEPFLSTQEFWDYEDWIQR